MNTNAKGNQEREEELEEQINNRIIAAQEKLAGKHEGLDIPTTLRKNRVWKNEGLGIEPIGSPGSFTTTNLKHGKAVKKLYKLLTKLKQPSKTKYKPLNEKVEELTNENEMLKDRLVKTANQFVAWQSEVDEIRNCFQIAQSSEQGLIESKRELQEELKEKNEIIKNLRLELVEERNKHANLDSNVTEVNFGQDKS